MNSSEMDGPNPIHQHDLFPWFTIVVGGCYLLIDRCCVLHGTATSQYSHKQGNDLDKKVIAS